MQQCPGGRSALSPVWALLGADSRMSRRRENDALTPNVGRNVAGWGEDDGIRVNEQAVWVAGLDREVARQEFVACYQGAYSRLVAQVQAITGDASLAREVVQEGFARAWQRWRSVRGLGDPVCWVRRVALQLAGRRGWRSRWGHPRGVCDPTAAVSDSAIAFSPVSAVVDPQSLLVLDALLRLPESQRRALVLGEMAVLPVATIAEEEGVTEQAISVRLARGRARLVGLLPEDGEVAPVRSRSRDQRVAEELSYLQYCLAAAVTIPPSSAIIRQVVRRRRVITTTTAALLPLGVLATATGVLESWFPAASTPSSLAGPAPGARAPAGSVLIPGQPVKPAGPGAGAPSPASVGGGPASGTAAVPSAAGPRAAPPNPPAGKLASRVVTAPPAAVLLQPPPTHPTPAPPPAAAPVGAATPVTAAPPASAPGPCSDPARWMPLASQAMQRQGSPPHSPGWPELAAMAATTAMSCQGATPAPPPGDSRPPQ